METQQDTYNKFFSELPSVVQLDIKNGKKIITEIDGTKSCLCNDMRIAGVKGPAKDFMLSFHSNSEFCDHHSLQYIDKIFKFDGKYIPIDFSNPPIAGEVISLIKPYETSFYPAILDSFGQNLVFPIGTKFVVCKRQYPNYNPYSEEEKQQLCVEITLLREGHNSSCVCGSCNYRHHIVQDDAYLQCYCCNSENLKQDNETCVIC